MAKQPVLALVGRPNVGKSTLFNRLTRSRDALVADEPGLTRDRRYGRAVHEGRAYIVVDTGGFTGEKEVLDERVAGQALKAVDEADAVLFLVDGRAGLCAGDENTARQLRQYGKPVFLVLNKTERLDKGLAGAEFHALGFGEPLAVSASHGEGVGDLMDAILATFADTDEADNDTQSDEQSGAKVAIVGRPNVGKSTLVNRLLGEDRVLAYDMPGTTRDSIYVPFLWEERPFTLIDTAGVRRRSRVAEKIEKFSIVKTLQAIDDANVVVLVLDGRQGVAEQDAHLLGYILDAGKALLIAVNKWDGLAPDQRDTVKRELERKLSFVDFARVHFISALHGSGVGILMETVERAYASATRKLSTPKLTRILEDAVEAHHPPLVRGRRIKLRYAHQGGQNPPLIVIHGNQTSSVPESYRRYLANCYRQALKLVGTPVRIEFKGSENPFEGRHNPLTQRQIAKRKRLVRHVKSKRR